MAEFLDYYELLQISPNAELETIQRVYRMLATRYHPDNPVTGDGEKFLALQEAYRVLSDTAARTAYDARYQLQRQRPNPVFEMKEFLVGIEAEAHRRLGVLCILYNRRRMHPDHPSVTLLDLEAEMAIPREHLEFTTWYLKDKGYIRSGECSDLLITSEGVDFVEKHVTRNRIVHKLLTAGAGEGWAADGRSTHAQVETSPLAQ